MHKAIETLASDHLLGPDGTKGILLIVDKNNILIGTVTDGDIRRALILGFNIESPLFKFMRKNPIMANENENREIILKKMKKNGIFHIPIVSSSGQLIDIETIYHLEKTKTHKNTVFLMAGGFGTRLQPLTDKLPKPLIPVGSKPILEIIIEQFIEFGFINFVISTHYKAEMIKNHFKDGSHWGVNIQYIFENEPLGTAGALGLLPKNIPDLPIIMMNGDILTKVNFNELLSYHNTNKAIATMCTREYSFKVPYGVIKTEKNHIIDIVEKPTHNFFINAGIYILEPKIINQVHANKFLDMPTLFKNQIELGNKVNSFPIHEYWIDIGRINQLDKANQEAISFFNPLIKK